MLTQKKMFVHYGGSKAEFVAAKNQEGKLYSEIYNNGIVFIGNGEAIYAKGQYYGDVKDLIASLRQDFDGLKFFKGIRVGELGAIAWSASKEGVITFTSDDNSVVTLNADIHGIHIGLAQSFVDKVKNTATGLAEEITRATNAENKIKNDLGTRDTNKGTAFERIAAIEGELDALSGGAGSISTQINNAISALDLPNTYEAKGEAAKAQAAAIAAASTDATTKANNAQAAAEATAAGALSAAVNTINGELAKKASNDDLSNAVSNLNSAISTAKSGAISDAKTYTNEEIAKLSEVYDAFGSAASALEDANDYTDAEIVKAKAYADGLAGNYDAKGSAAQALEDAKADAANKYQVKGDYEESGAAANALQEAKNFATGLDTEMDKRVKVLEGIDHDQLAADAASSAVATILDGAPEKFNTLKEVADWIANSESADSAADLVTRVAALEGIDHDAYVGADEANLAAAKKYTDDEIAELDLANTYDAKGAAASAETAAKSYTDTKIGELSFDAAGTAASEAASALAEAKTYVDGKVDGKFDAAGTAAGLNSAMDARVTVLEKQDVFVEENVNNAIATAEQNAKSYADGLAKNYDATGSAAAVQGNLDSEVSRAKQAEGELSNAIGEEATTRANEDARVLKEANDYTDAEVGKVNTKINGFNFATRAEDGFYVTGITQTNGQVSAVMGKAIAAEKITITDSADHFPSTVTNVEDALAFMADMLTWAEIE